ncbi:hypothetical protein [Fodinibius halophilus]|uniref:Uncharacterized protein n=1 Tax=Fodinibius halophilus TaxID=1736908 RepID=A0A6M1TB90_9BACT|nr:hypothetical protein [Fodinibius halophilus]NGP89291.1 hypothetical protein [Fodinibius halophilus]
MNYLNKISFKRFVVPVLGIWLAVDALNKLFVSQASDVTYRFYEYGMLDLMIPLAWAQLFVAILYIAKRTRPIGYGLLLVGLVLISIVRLKNGDGIVVQLVLILAATGERAINTFSDLKEITAVIEKTLCNNFTTMRRFFDC